MLQLITLMIGWKRLSQLPDVNILPYWLLVQLYTPKTEDRRYFEKALREARFSYRAMEYLRNMFVVAIVLAVAVYNAQGYGIVVPAWVVDKTFQLLALSAMVPPSILIMIGLDRPFWTLVLLHRELRRMPNPLVGGIFELHKMTEEEFEDRIDTAINTLSALCEQQRAAKQYGALRRNQKTLGGLIELSKQLDFDFHHTGRYHRVKKLIEMA